MRVPAVDQLARVVCALCGAHRQTHARTQIRGPERARGGEAGAGAPSPNSALALYSWQQEQRYMERFPPAPFGAGIAFGGLAGSAEQGKPI